MKLSGKGEYFPVIQVKDVSSDRAIGWNGLKEAVIRLRSREGIVRAGDVLLRAKGSPHYALYIEEPKRLAVAASQFFILRVNGQNRLIEPKKLLPSYLAWYLNQSPVQYHLNRCSAGTSIKIVNKRAVSEIPIEIPPIDIQKKIVSVYNLSVREKELLTRIQQAKEKLIAAKLLSLTDRRDHVSGS